ncbi:hypothetical protein Tmar_1322 [Thermaerobacter marianensis DSM 12885]|uniref:Uncharacterized protein n=1 Tax=Thermaerobacter marianensis (strain ATCC 700841 / DSM 12885 / JCM 10246 / 7p75a) TaxID=644966 RepID=E6SM76_THEM7|nr:hypothetical protein [Thermaerobacter marianensis]ADU51435.1 hypothetical protein Tmar_1322 [Thermaerobacter marianensis DSM 12885]
MFYSILHRLFAWGNALDLPSLPDDEPFFRAQYYAVYRFLHRNDMTIVQDRERRYFLWEGGPELRRVGMDELGRLLLAGAILPMSEPQPLPGLYAHMRPVYNPMRRSFEFRRR